MLLVKSDRPAPADGFSRLLDGDRQIDGVDFRHLEMHHDSRGCFTEVFQEGWNAGIRPVQWSVVTSGARVFRGMHLHLRHDEYVTPITGQMLVGLHDARPGSPTQGCWSLYELHGDDRACLTFPRGVLHGWYFPAGGTHLQAVSESYDSYGADDNWGCLWSDPALKIAWPFKQPIVGTKAARFPLLKDMLQQVHGARSSPTAHDPHA
jgi:dTDP-4-dehydrorhamnose 3,5-epimerase